MADYQALVSAATETTTFCGRHLLDGKVLYVYCDQTDRNPPHVGR
jgi:hypothetical protein